MTRCNLSTLMGKHRYTIEDVHKKTGLARKTISNLYNEKATRIDFQTLEKLCYVFNCDVNELLTIEMNDIEEIIPEKVVSKNE